jgi:hypothetical protein
MKNTAKPMTKTQIVYYPAPQKIYAPEEVREVFAPLAPGDPLAVVLRQILQQRLANAMVDAATVKATEREAGHAGGRIQELMDLSSELFGYMDKRGK